MATDSPTTTETPTPKLRWYRLTPDRLVVGVLVIEGFLLLSEWFDWFAFNRQTWTVLIALAVVGLALSVMFLWFILAMLLRRRFQYGIRSLMLLVVAVAVVCSWLAVEMRSERRQWAAAQTLEAEGPADPVEKMLRRPFGTVRYQQTWLGRLLRDESLVMVTSVDLTGKSTTDETLAHLHGLRQLEWLTISNTKITDAGLVHLHGLRQLQWLLLDQTKVTDAGLIHLQCLSQLDTLDLSNTRITDAGLAHLQGLKRLQTLRLRHTEVTDAGLVHLRGLSQLQELSLGNTQNHRRRVGASTRVEPTPNTPA